MIKTKPMFLHLSLSAASSIVVSSSSLFHRRHMIVSLGVAFPFMRMMRFEPTFGTDDQTSALAGASIHHLDDIDQLLSLRDRPVTAMPKARPESVLYRDIEGWWVEGGRL